MATLNLTKHSYVNPLTQLQLHHHNPKSYYTLSPFRVSSATTGTRSSRLRCHRKTHQLQNLVYMTTFTRTCLVKKHINSALNHSVSALNINMEDATIKTVNCLTPGKKKSSEEKMEKQERKKNKKDRDIRWWNLKEVFMSIRKAWPTFQRVSYKELVDFAEKKQVFKVLELTKELQFGLKSDLESGRIVLYRVPKPSDFEAVVQCMKINGVPLQFQNVWFQGPGEKLVSILGDIFDCTLNVFKCVSGFLLECMEHCLRFLFLCMTCACLGVLIILGIVVKLCIVVTKSESPVREIVKFADVVGVDEAMEELEEIVEFLRNQRRCTRGGAQWPKGVLMVGPSGTGKTLLAKAVAGEANVPFITCSASEFEDISAAEATSRIRDMFAKAKENTPSIIFIDEIEAMYSQIHMAYNDEGDQILNQILIEMDSLDDSSGVIVLGATNRPDILDPALCQPGRFNRVVTVEAPDRAGREAILKKLIYIRQLSLSKVIDLKEVATATTYLTGADLATLVRKAALLAGRENEQSVSRDNFMHAVEQTIYGVIKKHPHLEGADKAVIARHEVGHAITSTAVAKVCPGKVQIKKLSILSMLGGSLEKHAVQSENQVQHLVSMDELRGQLVALLGGCAVEAESYSEEISSKALHDVKQATALASKAIADYSQHQSVGPGCVKDQGHVRDLVQKLVETLLQSALEVATIVIQSNTRVLKGVGAQLEENEKINGGLLRDWLKSVVVPDELVHFIKDGRIPKSSKNHNSTSWIHRMLCQ